MMNAAIHESLNELQRWMPWAKPAPTVENSEEFSRLSLAKFIERTDLSYRLLLRDTQEFVGALSLQFPDWDIPKMEFGYWCHTAHAGHGYISEGIGALTRIAFEHLHLARLQIRCDTHNERSRRVAERNGFTYEGTLRCDATGVDGQPRDTEFFSLTREDYERLAAELPPIEILSC